MNKDDAAIAAASDLADAGYFRFEAEHDDQNYRQTVISTAAAIITKHCGATPSVASAAVFHCSCGAACDLEEYVQHRIKGHDAVSSAGPTIYADGFCERCSNFAYPLTRALEATGVPTGEANWQQTYGPKKVKAMDDHESCLRRLLLAMEEGTPDDVATCVQRAQFSIEFHASIRRKLTAQAQQRESSQVNGGSVPSGGPEEQ
jgi:hypothetical protein